MDYTPRYPQPFTLEQAAGLDVSTITEEIARLQNSLSRLRSTQAQLQEAHAESPDPEFAQAMEENEVVIGSQTERITILQMALAEKGIPMDGHYAVELSSDYVPPPPPPSSTLPAAPASPAAPQQGALPATEQNGVSATSLPPRAPGSTTSEDNGEAFEDGGIDL